MLEDRVYIIGVGAGGASSLPPEVFRLVKEAQVVFGGERLLGMFPSLTGQKITLKNNLAEVNEVIKNNLGRQRMVVLASGDPGFYGIARYLTKELGKDAVEIIPGVSAIQLAFARVKESWDDAAITSVHARPIEDIVALVHGSRKIGILTDDKHTPGKIAQLLRESGIENCPAYVCEELGTENERVIAADLYSLGEKEFSPLNVMVLLRQKEAEPSPLLGIPDEGFHRRRDGLITKLEVRAISLARMALTESSVLWDIGAGSGALSIEASLLAARGKVFAIDKDEDAVDIIGKNVRKFRRHNVEVILATAPDELEELPDPDVIFIGGSGGRMPEILSLARRRLRPGGRTVINAVTLETLHHTTSELQASGFAYEVTLVNIARSREIANLTRFEALTPVFVITAWRDNKDKH